QERPKKKQTLSQEEAYQTQPELSKYHTYDLLLLLSYLREQRSTAYKTMQSVRKAPNEVKTSRNDYDELNEYGQEFYREATARKNIGEHLLVGGVRRVPARIARGGGVHAGDLPGDALDAPEAPAGEDDLLAALRPRARIHGRVGTEHV